MVEILGLGCTHRPLMMRPDKGWTHFINVALEDPDMPEEWKDRAKWPAKMREELGNDFGVSEAGRHRAVLKKNSPRRAPRSMRSSPTS